MKNQPLTTGTASSARTIAMTSRSLLSRLFRALMLIFMGTVAFSAQALQAESQGKIQAFIVIGDVSIKDNATERLLPLSRGQEFTDGYTVITGENSRCTLLFSNGSAVGVAPESEINIEKFTQDIVSEEPLSFLTLQGESSASDTKLLVEKGEIISHIKPLISASNYTATTPQGSVTVKGTTFTLGFNAQTNTTTISTVQGLIEVSFAGNVFSLPEGQSVSLSDTAVGQILENDGLDGFAFIQAIEAAIQVGANAQAAAINAGASNPDSNQFGNTIAASTFVDIYRTIRDLPDSTPLPDINQIIQIITGTATTGVGQIISDAVSQGGNIGPNINTVANYILSLVTSGSTLQDAISQPVPAGLVGGPTGGRNVGGAQGAGVGNIPVPLSPL